MKAAIFIAHALVIATSATAVLAKCPVDHLVFKNAESRTFIVNEAYEDFFEFNPGKSIGVLILRGTVERNSVVAVHLVEAAVPCCRWEAYSREEWERSVARQIKAFTARLAKTLPQASVKQFEQIDLRDRGDVELLTINTEENKIFRQITRAGPLDDGEYYPFACSQ